MIPIELGSSHFAPGDLLTIEEVRGDHDEFVQGGTYRVRVRYVLASHPRALLAVFATNGEVSGSEQHLIVEAGSGSFELTFKLERIGYPHVSFYPDNGGDGFGGVYFGHGDLVFHGKAGIDRVGP